MKNTLSLLAILVIVPATSFARRVIPHTQMPSVPKLAFKVYNTFSYSKMEETIPVNLPGFVGFKRITKTDLFKPSVAFSWRSPKGNYQEVEVSSFVVGKKSTENFFRHQQSITPIGIGGTEVTTTDIAIRYENVKDLFKRKNWKLRPMLGLSLSAFYRSEKIGSNGIDPFVPLSEQRYGVKFEAIPRINYNISRRIFLDFNIPVTIAQSDIWVSKVQTTSISKVQKTSLANFAAAPMEIAARIGVGIRL